MLNTIKHLVLSTVAPVQRLQQNRDELQSRVAAIEGENLLRKGDLQRTLATPPAALFDFDADGMKLWDKNLKSLQDPRFVEAYARGAPDYVHIEFRAYVACWAASHAAKLPGDFVECGVNEGWLSLTICNYLDFNAFGKSFFLLDTYDGIPSEQISERESARAALHHYVDCYEATKTRFAAFPNAKLIKGRVPETLLTASIDRISYLSIDMNIAKPERDAIEFFWPKLATGGVVVLDDYAFSGYDAQHETMDEFAAKMGVSILTLPTGQGLLIKQ